MVSPPPKNPDPAYAAENNFGRMMAVNGTFHALAVISVVLRMYIRIHMVKSFGVDDAFMIAALLFLSGGGMVAQIYSGTHGALGRHQDSTAVTLEQMHVYGKMRFVQGVLMTITSICLLKFSIGFSLLRLDSNRWYRRALWALLIFVFSYMVESWISLLGYCTPIKAAWDMEAAKTARCFPLSTVNTFATMNTAFNIFTDVCFATIPIPMLWALQTRLRVRLYLIAIFNLGYITVAIGIVKLFYQQTTRGDRDKTFKNYIQFYGLLQQNLGIIAACAPTLKPLFAKVLRLQGIYGTDHSAQARTSASRAKPSVSGYTRQDKDTDFEMHQWVNGPKGQQHITVAEAGSDHGSETLILQDVRPNQVVKKTEITIVDMQR